MNQTVGLLLLLKLYIDWTEIGFLFEDLLSIQQFGNGCNLFTEEATMRWNQLCNCYWFTSQWGQLSRVKLYQVSQLTQPSMNIWPVKSVYKIWNKCQHCVAATFCLTFDPIAVHWKSIKFFVSAYKKCKVQNNFQASLLHFTYNLWKRYSISLNNEFTIPNFSLQKGLSNLNAKVQYCNKLCSANFKTNQ